MTRARLLVAALVAGCAAWTAPTPSHADDCDSQWADPQRVIADCTARLNGFWMPDDNRAGALFNRGTAQLKIGELDRAIRDLDEVIRLRPSSGCLCDSYNARGWAYQQKGDLRRAESDFRQALRINPGHQMARSNLALLQQQRSQSADDQRRQLEDAEALRRERALAERQRRDDEAERQRGQAERARQETEQKRQEEQRQAATADARTCEKATGEESLAACTREIESGRLDGGGRSKALVNRGFTYRKMGELDQALIDYDAAIRLQPDFATSYNNRGYVHVLKRQIDQAIRDFDKAIELDPKFAIALNNRGDAYLRRDDPDRAIPDLDRAVAIDPKLGIAWNNRGDAYFRKGDFDRAIQDLDTAISIHPEYVDAFNNRGRAYRGKGDIDRAIKDYEVAIRLAPNFAAAWNNRGFAYELKGDLQRAENDFRKAVALDGNYEIAKGNLARVEPKLAEVKAQEEVLRQAEAAEAAKLVEEKRRQEAEAMRLAEAERLRQEELARRDVTPPVIEIAGQIESAEIRPVAKGRVADDRGAATLTVDGKPIELDAEGRFTLDYYMAEGQKRVLTLVATDAAGNAAKTEVTLTRIARQISSGPELARLDPSRVRAQPRPDAVALVVGISQYDATSKASFADQDALVFKDYAELALGVPPANIIHLDQSRADRLGILEALTSELAARIVPGKSDVFVFFAGHGLTDGQGRRYLLPRNGRPSLRLLEDSALRRERVVEEIMALQPRHATLFLDTCFTGETRDSQALCDGCRLVGVRVAKEPEKPGLTIIAAAAEDQVSSALDKAGHGLFSYWLMKGLEGDADLNQDKAITAKELHAYLNSQVPRQARVLGRDQTPTLEGDGDVVLARLK